MSDANVIQFRPGMRLQSDRAFWVDRQTRRLEMMAQEVANVALADRDHSDTSPSELNPEPAA